MNKKILAFLSLLTIIFSMFGGLLVPEKTSALPSNSWINRTTIIYLGEVFTDTNTFDQNYIFTGAQSTEGCSPTTIKFNATKTVTGGSGRSASTQTTSLTNSEFYYNDGLFNRASIELTAQHKVAIGGTSGSECQNSTVNPTIANPKYRRITFVYTDASQTQIKSIMNNALFQRQDPFAGAGRYARTDDNEACKDLIITRQANGLRDTPFGANEVSESSILYAVRNGNANSAKKSETYREASSTNGSNGVQTLCEVAWSDSKYVDIMEAGYGMATANDADGAGGLVANGVLYNGGSMILDLGGNGKDDAFIIFIGPASQNLQPTPTVPPASAPDTINDVPSCEASGFSLSWVLCPISEGLASVSDWILNNFLVPFLQPSPIGLDPSDPVGGKTYQIWSAVRVYGNIILVFALLFAVFGQAISGGLFEAYTARKMLPRILVSAILINISIYIVALAVDLSRIIGNNLVHLITAPLSATGNYAFKVDSTTGWIIGGGMIAAVSVGIWALGGGGLMPFLFFFMIMPAFLTIVGAFITILLLQALIISLVISAPVAFALYCLPNTEKYFHTWWEWFYKALLIFPIFMVIVGVSYLMTSLVQQANGGGWMTNLVTTVIAFFVQFLPLVLVPFAFKLAGGVIGKVSQLLGGYGGKLGEFFKGNPNDPLSARNQAKKNFAAGFTRQQKNLHDRAMFDPQASRWTKLKNRGSSMLKGRIEERDARYNKDARELEEAMSGTGRDGKRYAAAGFIVRAGEQAPSHVQAGQFNDGKYDASRGWGSSIVKDENGNITRGGTVGWDRYFDGKGRQITGSYFSQGKSDYGKTLGDVSQAFNYVTRKIQTDDDIANMRYAYEQNAKEYNWNDKEGGDVWAAATFEYKPQLGSEWYSSPQMIRQGGRTVGVHFRDVANDDDKYLEMITEDHKSKEGYKYSSKRDQDWRAQGYKVDQIEALIPDPGTGVPTLSPKQFKMAAMTKEVIGSVTQKGLRDGTFTETTDGQILVTGPGAASANVVAAIQSNAKYGVANYFDPTTGKWSASERILFDRKAVAADKERALGPGGSGRFNEQEAQQQHAIRDGNDNVMHQPVTGAINRPTIIGVGAPAPPPAPPAP